MNVPRSQQPGQGTGCLTLKASHPPHTPAGAFTCALSDHLCPDCHVVFEVYNGPAGFGVRGQWGPLEAVLVLCHKTNWQEACCS